MKKRILSIVLAICLVLTLVPTTVFAANDDATALQSLLSGGGTVTLSRDYTIDTTLNVTNTVTLDLNGYTISMTGSDSVIKVGSGGNLTLQDSSAAKTGVITGGNASLGGGVYINGGSFTLNGGTIANCSASSGGGGVAVAYGAFTMNGGTIQGCSAYYGGGVYLNANSSMTLNGGSIQSCSATIGGGVYLEINRTMTMTGGAIEACTSTNGKSDAVNIYSNASLLANGGTIKGTVTVVSYSAIQNTSADGCTVFYDAVTNNGTISGGIYYGGIQGSGTVTGTYYTVTFDLNGGSGTVPTTQWFVNISTAKALQPADPTREGGIFKGWYNGDTAYDFTQPVTENITLTAKWVLTDVSDESGLRAALDAGATTIKLMADIKLSSALDLSLKNITIDLNGYVISGADISINTGNGKASLTLIDSRPTATHTDSTLPVGGVVTSKISMKQSGGKYNDCVLYANGGTVTSEFNTNTNAVAIKCTSNTPTAFTGKITGYAHLYGGIYYGTIVSPVTIEGKKITFQNGDNTYAYEIVDSGNKTVEPISPPVKDGYNAFDGWYNGDTKYTFGSSLSEDITLTAVFSNPKTYNISYDLNGGTVSPENPGDYTIESENITLNNPTKTGYTFIGWSGTDLSSNTMIVTIPKGSTGDRAYTAHYTEKSDYTVVFDANGGSEVPSKTNVKWTDKVLDGITAPTKDGWEFTGWKCGDTTVTADTTYSELAVNDTVTSVTLVAQWKDIAAPTGEIKVSENSWKTFLNKITFGLFFKDTQTVTITASDNSGETVTIEYLLSDRELDETELASATFTAYTDKFSINPDNKYVVYVKLTDHAGNVTYISSNGIVLDATSPVITGVENNKTYCEAQTVTVTEEYIESVKVNDVEVTLDANNQFTLNPAEGTQTIVVTDKAGNVSAEMIVTVNDGHTYEWQSENGQYWQKCKYCDDETAKKDIPTFTIDAPDTVCRTQDCEVSVTLPDSISDAALTFEFIGLGGAIDTTVEDGKLYDVVTADGYPNAENSFNLVVYATTTDGFSYNVSKTVEIQNEHAGGVATCTELAICDTCGEPYGELDSTNHNLEKISAKDATVTETGNIEYWHCLDCGKYFADENGENEIEFADTVIAKLPPEIIKGTGQSITQGEKKALSFTSNAAFGDFIRVELDGKTLDAKNYTVKEGSTVVTLTADYVSTLSAGEHTIGIVSESGTAETTFTVNAKAVNNDKKSPETGNGINSAMWLALLLSCGGAIIVTGAYSKRKKHSSR